MSASRSLSDHAASFRRNIQPGTQIFVCVSDDQKSHLLNTLFCLLNQLEALELRWALLRHQRANQETQRENQVD